MKRMHPKKRLAPLREGIKLVVDNAPGENPLAEKLEAKVRLKYEAQWNQKEQEHSQEIEDLNTRAGELLGRQKRKGLIYGAILATVISGLFLSYQKWHDSKMNPLLVVPLGRDLNRDGTNDAYLLREDRHKVPLYGIRTSANQPKISYLTAKELMEKKLGFNEANKDFYQNIETKLNQE